MFSPGNGIGWILSIGCAQLARVDGDVDQAGATVGGGVLVGERVAQAHLREGGQLDLHELDRHAADGDLGAGDDAGGQQAHRLDRVLGHGVLDVGVDGRQAVHAQGRGADAVDPHPEQLEVEAQVLDHVVGAGVADGGDALAAGGGHDDVLRHGVAALGEDDREVLRAAARDQPVVVAGGRGDVEPEGPQADQVRLDGPGAEVAAARVGEPELVLEPEQRAQEHDDRPGAAGGVDVDGVEVEVPRDDDLEVAAVRRPRGADADGAQHLDDPVHLDDAGDVPQPRGAAVEQRRAQQRDGAVLAGVDVDPAAQGLAALHAQVGALGAAERDDGGVERGADAGQHLEADVLRALLDAVDRGLAGGQALRELGLRQAAVLAGRADQGADVRERVLDDREGSGARRNRGDGRRHGGRR